MLPSFARARSRAAARRRSGLDGAARGELRRTSRGRCDRRRRAHRRSVDRQGARARPVHRGRGTPVDGRGRRASGSGRTRRKRARCARRLRDGCRRVRLGKRRGARADPRSDRPPRRAGSGVGHGVERLDLAARPEHRARCPWESGWAQRGKARGGAHRFCILDAPTHAERHRASAGAAGDLPHLSPAGLT